MKTIKIALLLLLCRLSLAQMEWSNGEIVTHLGVGAGGQDISAFNVDALTTTFGLQTSWSASGVGPAYLADDFIPEADLTVERLGVFYYMANNPSPSLDFATVKIYRGDPLAGGSLIHDMEGNGVQIFSFGPYINPATSRFVYRTSASTGAAATSSTRRLQFAWLSIGQPVRLLEGNQYYICWSLNSPDGTSIFSPSLGRRGNGRQELTANGTPDWGEALGTATNPNSDVDLPFMLMTSDVNTDPYNVFPDSAIVIEGLDFGGSVSNLMVSDDERMLWLSDNATTACEVEFIGTGSNLFPHEIRLGAEVSAGRPGLSTELMMYNYVRESWEVQGFFLAPTDTQVQLRIFERARDYVNPDMQMRARIRWQPVNDEDPSQDGWFLAADWCRWRILPSG